MRVIAGKARRLQLVTVPGRDTRPTTDRIKETLFNMLQPYLPGARFLDLFAGSGGIGIEALSRGASHAVFVEQNRQAVSCIRQNLSHTHLEQEAEVYPMDVMRALVLLQSQGPFDLIFMDPPYGRMLERTVLEQLSGSPLIHPGTLLIAEIATDTPLDWLEQCGYRLEKLKTYKTNAHAFIRSLQTP